MSGRGLARAFERRGQLTEATEPAGAPLVTARPVWRQVIRQAARCPGLIGVGIVLGIACWILAPLLKLAAPWFG